MITLDSVAQNHLTNIMQSIGGFAWWYVDIVGADDTGVVLIWSYGLPFLPGSRRQPRPVERPALALAVYRGEKTEFYLLQQYAREDALCVGGRRWVLGDSDVSWDRDRGVLHAALDLPLSGGRRLEGEVELNGAAIHSSMSSSPGHDHAWQPIMAACAARADLRIGDETHVIEGRGYFDSNASARPITELGIADWYWGRIALSGRDLVYFVLLPEDGDDDEPISMLLDIDGEGGMTRHTARFEFSDVRSARYGLRYPHRVRLSSDDIALDVVADHCVDDGPFYLRYIVEGLAGGERGRGIAERVVPSAIDRPWQRPLVNMRVHRPGGDSSMWLPLFSDSRRGRIARLLRSWLLTPSGAAR